MSSHFHAATPTALEFTVKVSAVLPARTHVEGPIIVLNDFVCRDAERNDEIPLDSVGLLKFPGGFVFLKEAVKVTESKGSYVTIENNGKIDLNALDVDLAYVARSPIAHERFYVVGTNVILQVRSLPPWCKGYTSPELVEQSLTNVSLTSDERSRHISKASAAQSVLLRAEIF